MGAHTLFIMRSTGNTYVPSVGKLGRSFTVKVCDTDGNQDVQISQTE